MKTQLIKGALAAFVLAGAAVMTGCSCSPVAEEIVTDSCATPVYQTRTFRTLAPVASQCDIPLDNTATLCD